MISDEKWDEAVNNAADSYKKKCVRVIETNGKVFEGICDGYCEDDDDNGDACWTILVGWRKFFQKEVESIELV